MAVTQQEPVVVKDVPLPRGFRAAGVHCGIKARRPDLALVWSETPASAAGMFTQILTRAPSVVINEERLRAGRAQAVMVNSGNANACTGERGYRDAHAVAAAAAAALGVGEELVLATSTGVIGQPLPVEKIFGALPALVEALEPDGLAAAEAMRTTDAFAKAATTTIVLDGVPVAISGIAKGAGMIHPDMATMIAVLATDAALEPGALRAALRGAVGASFNCISVDGDTSTNDSVFVLANGASGVDVGASGPAYEAFANALGDVSQRLARMIVADGEGTCRVVELLVTGARSDEEARSMGRTVMTSMLVKSSFHGSQLNWGRLAAAAGRAGVPLDPERLSIRIGDVEVVRSGVGVECAYDEAEALLDPPEVRVTIDLGLGEGSFRGWTSDLSLEYVRFNSGEPT